MIETALRWCHDCLHLSISEREGLVNVWYDGCMAPGSNWEETIRKIRSRSTWRILQAPMMVVNYLIVHELAHVLEPNHSQGFRNIVAVHAPS